MESLKMSEEAYNYYKAEFEGKPKTTKEFALGLMAEIQLEKIWNLPLSKYIADWHSGDGGFDLKLPLFGTVDIKCSKSGYDPTVWTVHKHDINADYFLFVKINPIFLSKKMPEWSELTEEEKIIEIVGFLPQKEVFHELNFHKKGTYSTYFHSTYDTDCYIIREDWLLPVHEI